MMNYEIGTLTPFARNDKKGESLRGNEVAEAISSVIKGGYYAKNPHCG